MKSRWIPSAEGRSKTRLPVLLGTFVALSACGQDESLPWAASVDSAARQFQLIQQAEAQERNSPSPEARSTYESMQTLWGRMNRAQSGMMHSMRGGMMGGHGMGGMMNQPMVMQYNEMSQQMLSYCLGMQQLMDRTGDAGMAEMYGRMADRMRMLLSRLPPSTATAPSSANGTAPASDGAAIFAANCASCHGAGGEGVGGVFPPLNGSAVLNGPQDVPIKIVLHGLQGPLTVGGARYDGLMPAFGGTLTDAAIAAVLTHVHSLPGNTASTVAAEDVQSARAQTASRSAAFAPSELGLE